MWVNICKKQNRGQSCVLAGPPALAHVRCTSWEEGNSHLSTYSTGAVVLAFVVQWLAVCSCARTGQLLVLREITHTPRTRPQLPIVCYVFANYQKIGKKISFPVWCGQFKWKWQSCIRSSTVCTERHRSDESDFFSTALPEGIRVVPIVV